MKYLKLIPFLFLFSCSTIYLGKTGYIITDYDSRGEVEKTYFVKDYEIFGDSVEFKVDSAVKSVKGSFKVEKLTN